MSIIMTTVFGTVEFPNGATPPRAVVRFRLNKFDKNTQNIFLGTSEFPVSENGKFTASVQTTDGMDELTVYEVTLSYFDVSSGNTREQMLGMVKIPESETDLWFTGLLPIRIPADASSVYRSKRGDTISFGIQSVDRHGVPIDLRDYSISATMRQGSSLIPFAVTRVNPFRGRFDLTLSASQSSVLALGSYVL